MFGAPPPLSHCAVLTQGGPPGFLLVWGMRPCQLRGCGTAGGPGHGQELLWKDMVPWRLNAKHELKLHVGCLGGLSESNAVWWLGARVGRFCGSWRECRWGMERFLSAHGGWGRRGR